MILTEFLSNLSEIITALTVMFKAILPLFMEPPLSLFIGIVLFLTILVVIQHMIYSLHSNQYNISARKLRLESEQKYGMSNKAAQEIKDRWSKEHDKILK